MGIHFAGNTLCVSLSDGREIKVPMEQVGWLGWLAKASPKERANWSIEPGGYAIYWNNLDDGFEICHLLDMRPLG